jgi:uncharacterized membrane protein YeaQ/YmgE (transglycosylase-associated protein family)
MGGFLMAVIIGGIIGWLASIMMGTNAQMGIVANIVVGIVGANLGTWLGAAIGFAPMTMLALIVESVAGASLLIVILRAVGIFK